MTEQSPVLRHAGAEGRAGSRSSFDPVFQNFLLNPGQLPPLSSSALSADALRARFQRELPWTPEALDGNPMRPESGQSRASSVLIPLVMRPQGLQVLLTRRSEWLKHHAGQISFPGGRADPTDPDLLHTALRETWEEIGVGADHIQVLGRLPDHLTVTGFKVAPHIGLVHPAFDLRLDPAEVAEVFEVPLLHLMNPRHHRLHRISTAEARVRSYFSMPWHDYFIWGATAGMLRNLYHYLRAGEHPAPRT